MMDAVNRYCNLLENVACNLCGADDYKIVYPARYEMASPEKINEAFRSSGDEILVDQLVECKKCGLQYLNPRLKQDVVLNAYSEGTDETFVSQASAREKTFAKCLDVIESAVPGRGRILDVGTAGGSFLAVAKKRGWQVAGCEPNRWLCQWAGQKYGINIHAGTIFDMNLANNSFDVVTLWDVLEHTPDPRKVLLECQRILKPNGVLVVNYPDVGASVSRLMGRKWVFLLSVHLYYFTVPSIKKMLEATGFKALKVKKHWQSLELDYILYRMKPYAGALSDFGRKAVKLVGMQKVSVPYWMGQMLVLARKNS